MIYRPERSRQPYDQTSRDSQLLPAPLPNSLNESPLSFDDMAIEIDMARKNVDMFMDEDEADGTPPVSTVFTRTPITGKS